MAVGIDGLIDYPRAVAGVEGSSKSRESVTAHPRGEKG